MAVIIAFVPPWNNSVQALFLSGLSQDEDTGFRQWLGRHTLALFNWNHSVYQEKRRRGSGRLRVDVFIVPTQSKCCPLYCQKLWHSPWSDFLLKNVLCSCHEMWSRTGGHAHMSYSLPPIWWLEPVSSLPLPWGHYSQHKPGNFVKERWYVRCESMRPRAKRNKVYLHKPRQLFKQSQNFKGFREFHLWLGYESIVIIGVIQLSVHYLILLRQTGEEME